MSFCEQQLKVIEKMASLFFPPESIAINLELQEPELFLSMIEMRTGPAFAAYMRGRLQTEIELREAIKMAAINGSSPAQGLMIQFFKESSL